MKVFRIESFAGGYNTAVAEANLPLNMSQDMVNVDFTDTGALTRRRGYATVSATFGSGSALKALYRYYQSDGDKYWVGVNATAMYYKQHVATEFGWTRKEGLNLTFSGGRTEVTHPDYSGGSVSRVVAATAVTVSGIPYSNRIKVRFYTPTAASFKVDAGSFVNLSATLYETTVSATSHTLTIKPAARNTKAAKVSTDKVGEYGRIERTMTAVSDVYFHCRFYSSGAATDGVRVAGLLGDDGLVYGLRWKNGGYTFGVANAAGYDAASCMSSVSDSAGWHTFEMWLISGERPSAAIDGINLDAFGPNPGPTFSAYVVQIYGTSSTARTFVVDDVRVRYAISSSERASRITPPTAALISDFSTLTGWSDTGNSSIAATLDTSIYDTQAFPWYIDYVDYAAIAAPTRIDFAVAATADTIGFAVANDVLYWGSKYDPLKSWNGTTSATVTATVKAEFLTAFKYRLFAASGYLLNYTAVDDYDGWAVTGGGSINVAEADSGAYCTGMRVWSDRLFWFGPSSIHYIDVVGDPVNWERRVVTRSCGCAAPKTLVDAGNALVFLSANAVRAYGLMPGINSDDGSGVLDLSRNIAPTIASIPSAMLTKACAAYYNGRYWLACSTSSTTENDTLLVCDLDRRVRVGEEVQPVWTRYDISGISSFTVTRGDEYGLYAGTSTGRIIQLDTGDDDDGETISLRYVTPPLGVRGYSTVKRFRHLHTSIAADAAQTITITPSTDDVNGQEAVIDVTGDTDLQPSRKVVSARGRYIKYTITSDGASQPVTLHSLETTYHPNERLR